MPAIERLIPPRFAWLAAILAGALLPAALAPIDIPAADLIAIALLFFLVHRARVAQAFWLGWWFGLGKYGAGVSWVYVSIHDYGPAPPWLAGGLVVLFVASLALFPALMTAMYAGLASRWRRGVGMLRAGLVFAACWVVFEWLLTWVLTGFPWLYAGYAHLRDPLANLAPLGGVLLVGLAAAVSAVAFVAAAMERGRARVRGLVIALLPWLIGTALMPVEWVQQGDAHRVALVQGNIPQDQKWLRENVGPTLERYARLSAPHWQTGLVIWPEAAITLFEHQADGYLEAMAARARADRATLVLGLPAAERNAEGEFEFFNTARAIGDGAGRYVKRRLVPFGEYVPLERYLRGLIAFFDLPMSRAVSGAEHQGLLEAGDLRLAMAICYEIVYPNLVRVGAEAADALVTISNDAWFGRSMGPHQHMQMAQMRAIENGRWLLRATNSGVTAIVDANGRITAQLPQFEAAALTGEFHSMTGTTPYTRLGDAPVLVLLLVLTLVSFVPFFDSHRP